jgi:signal transduction histidine kinase
LIKIEDTGVGIKAEEITKVFEGFYRAKQDVTHAEPGTGLGLRIVKDIIEQHGGKIMVESQLGLGTVITLTIPPFEAMSSRDEDPGL